MDSLIGLFQRRPQFSQSDRQITPKPVISADGKGSTNPYKVSLRPPLLAETGFLRVSGQGFFSAIYTFIIGDSLTNLPAPKLGLVLTQAAF